MLNLMHEVNSFSPVITTERNFKADHLFYGEDVVASAIEEDKQLAGFLSVVEEQGRGKGEGNTSGTGKIPFRRTCRQRVPTQKSKT